MEEERLETTKANGEHSTKDTKDTRSNRGARVENNEEWRQHECGIVENRQGIMVKHGRITVENNQGIMVNTGR